MFVANPKKPEAIETILRRNKDRLLAFLKEFHNEKDGQSLDPFFQLFISFAPDTDLFDSLFILAQSDEQFNVSPSTTMSACLLPSRHATDPSLHCAFSTTGREAVPDSAK